MEVIFLFPFCFVGVLSTASTTVASLANVSGDFSSYCSFSLLPIEISMSTVSVYIVDISGCVFPLSFWVPALAMAVFFWALLAFSFLLDIVRKTREIPSWV